MAALPVVVDATGEDDENVPDKFREVQWTDPLMDPLRNEPRFQAIVEALNFPD